MGQALYRKYRSKTFDDVVGQDHVTKTLQNAIKSGKISHAYLFTGPRGVGKTSVARILAHEINGLDYTDESIHLDIIEIDAASNRRIDEIRDLRDKVNVAPTTAKYKVYIIDEVHMLTREAFNALLKTLEEPPAHCVFILATTEAHKLPETIVSRTQRFEFKPVSRSQAADHLANLAKLEKISVTPEALDLLAQFGNGSFRDSISYLDQLSTLGKEVTADEVRSVLGLPAETAIDQLATTLDNGDSAKLLKQLDELEAQGVNATAVAAALSSKIRAEAARGNAEPARINLLGKLLQVSASSRPQDTLEIILLSVCAANAAPAPKTSSGSPEPVTQPKASSANRSPEITDAPEPANTEQVQPAKTSGKFNLNDWPEVVNRSKHEAASIYTALRLAEPSYENGTLTLGFQFPLHQKKLEQAKNKELVAKIVQEVSGDTVQIESVVVEKTIVKAAPVSVVAEEPPAEPLSAISQIFGNAEVMEA